MSLLKLDGVQTRYGHSQVLFDVSLDVDEGEVVALLGRNGMGKTTTIRSIMSLTPAFQGDIRFRDRALRAIPAHRIARLGIGLVPEGRHIFPNLNVRENLVALASRAGGGRSWSLAQVYELFPRLAERAANMGWQLSGGEQQMLAIGRALMTSPRLLVLDEATEGLAPLIRGEIWRVLDLLKRHGLAILVIDKNLDDVLRIADRVFVLEKGRTAWHGAAPAFRAERDVQARYLGI
ncbi:MAG: ABC transporter ATP-binding protein [Bordetella sp. SCN 67-23]|nr:ABC transporter ATP-binding protein [Burkholderiales bacterium]ODS74041.1 MAG: ABC transporter ATP-binding protein [Bordetella sp. SCN 67-23]ODU87346.1 MAG: ABC transporter ATP-binding protein [Bordetella sp. SCN 68-11]OJW85969.1 MAG: ABC transporter ATP-binding protein [Burkholderiales bacterium 67-32]